MDYIEIDGHKLHLFRTGDETKPKLVFMSGSGTVSPVYDFKILYEKLVSDFRIIVIEKFGYGCSDLYEGPCDVDSVVAYQRRALENAELADAAGAIACPILMFISDGKQVSSGWIEHGRAFAELMNAGTIYLNCGHYMHYYESDRISQEITSFVKQDISS